MSRPKTGNHGNQKYKIKYDQKIYDNVYDNVTCFRFCYNLKMHEVLQLFYFLYLGTPDDLE